MMKRWLFVALLFALCLALPAAADLTVDGVTLDDTTPQSGAGWQWTPGTLSLNGFTGRSIAITGQKSVNVAVSGANSFSGAETALRVAGSVTLTGSGSLKLAATDTAVHITGDLSVTDTGLTAEGGARGLFVGGQIILNKAKLNATGDGAIIAKSVDAKESELTASGRGDNVAIATGSTGISSWRTKNSTYADCVIRINGGGVGFGTAGYISPIPNYTFTRCDVKLTHISGVGITSSGVDMTDTTFTLADCGGTAIYAAQTTDSALTLHGGNTVTAYGDRNGLNSFYFRLTNTDTVHLLGGRGAASPGVIELDGKEIKNGGLARIDIVNGVYNERYGMTALNIGGESYGMAALLSNKSGDGWTWDADTGALALHGYRGGAVKITGAPLLTLAGESALTGDLEVTRLFLGGTGRLDVSGNATSEMTARFMGGDLFVGKRFTSSDLLMEGGSLVPDSLVAHIIDLNGGLLHAGNVYPQPYAVNVRGGILDGFGNLTTRTFTMTGGTVRVSKQGDGTFTLTADVVKITGGSIYLNGRFAAIMSQSITIGGTTTARLIAGVTVVYPSYDDEPMYVNICGYMIGVATHVYIDNGVITSIGNEKPALQIGDTWIFRNDLKKDCAGTGWRYEGKRKTLTFDGVDDPALAVSIYTREVKVKLAPDTKNRLGSIYGMMPASTKFLPVSLTGERSTLNCRDISASSITLRGVTLTQTLNSDIAMQSVELVDSSANFYEMEDVGKIILKNSTLRVARPLTCKTLTAKQSHVYLYAEDGAPATLSAKKATLKDSVLMTGSGNQISKMTLPGSLYLMYDGSDACWDVMRSATLRRDMTLPAGAYRVPAGVALTAKPGVRVRFGGKLTVYGTVVGDIAGTDAGAADVSDAALAILLDGETVGDRVTRALAAGETAYLTAMCDAAAGEASWTSSNRKVADVDAQGTLTIKKAGKTTITCTVGAQTASFRLVVAAEKAARTARIEKIGGVLEMA